MQLGVRVVALLLVLLSCIVHSHGQITGPGCEPFAGSPPQCTSLISGNVFVAPGVTQAAAAKNLTDILGLVSLAGLPPACLGNLIPFSCAVAFRPCDATATEPLPLCTSLCTDSISLCQNTIASSTLATCPTLMDFQGNLIFEDMRGNLTCVQPNIVNGSSVPCFFPLGYNPETDRCDVLCPAPPYNSDLDQRRYDYQNWVINSLSLISSLFFLIPWTYHGIKQRNLHKKYPYWYCFSGFMIHIAFAMMYGGVKKWKCVGSFEPKTQHNDGVIVLQGFLGATFIFGLNCWINCLLLSVALKVVKPERSLVGPKGTFWGVPEWIVFHVFCWGSSLVVFIIITAQKTWIAGNGGIAIPESVESRWHVMGPLLIPSMVLACLALTLFVLLLIVVWQRAKFLGLKSQIRLCVLCIWYAFVSLYTTINFIRQDKILRNIVTYISCTQTGRTDCPLDVLYSYWIVWVSNALFCSICLVFGLLYYSKEVLNQWIDMFNGVSRSSLFKSDSNSGETTGKSNLSSRY